MVLLPTPLAQFHSIGTIRPLTPAAVTSTTESAPDSIRGLPAFLAQTSQHSASNHVMYFSIALSAIYHAVCAPSRAHSFRRRPESSAVHDWTPASAGVTSFMVRGAAYLLLER
jgi:hypothetical protein